MNKKYFLSLCLWACATVSFAQFVNGTESGKQEAPQAKAWKGMRLSYDRTFSRFDYKDADDCIYDGFTLGYVHAFSLTKKLPLFIETGGGVTFARYGETDDNNTKYNTSVVGLTIPANVVYEYAINSKLSLKPYTGFYVRINVLSRNERQEDSGGHKSWNNYKKDDVGEYTWNRVQGGWQIGATLDVRKFNIGIGYALDFNEISEKTKWGIFSARLGFNF